MSQIQSLLRIYYRLPLPANADMGEKARDAGLLFLRLTASAMMLFGHGWGKLAGFAEKSATFSDPLGVGSATSLSLAIFGEVFCPLFVALGLFTRLTAFPVVFTMLVAALLVHADDPWKKMEFALLFAVPFATLMLTGPGAYSLDRQLHKRLGQTNRHH